MGGLAGPGRDPVRTCYRSLAAQTEAETRLGAKGISPDKLTEFKARAAKASTPEQIATIEAEYK